MTSSNSNVTQLLQAWGHGDREALDRLLPLVYDELKQQAKRYLRRENPGHTLQTTAIVHEAYLKLIGQQSTRWQNRSQFFGIASQLMRRILMDHARNRRAAKRGGSMVEAPLDEVGAGNAHDSGAIDLLELDDALNKLAEVDSQQAKVVELRYFTGLGIEETAEALGISPATVKREWAMARTWLKRELSR